MERAEKFVPWNVEITVIAFKVTMMDLVMKHTQMQSFPVAEPQAFEPGVRGHSRQRIKHQVKDHVHRVTRHDKMDQYRPEIHQMLDGMHRQARPRADVGIAVVQSVEPVQSIDMQETVKLFSRILSVNQST